MEPSSNQTHATLQAFMVYFIQINPQEASMRLQVIIQKDETGYYVAEVPALPGCMSQGKSLTEAKENIKEAIAGWIQVMNDKARKQKALHVAVLV